VLDKLQGQIEAAAKAALESEARSKKLEIMLQAKQADIDMTKQIWACAPDPTRLPAAKKREAEAQAQIAMLR
jgi:hypothetical protein